VTVVQVVLGVYLLASGNPVVNNLPLLLVAIFGVLLLGWSFLARKLGEKHVPAGAPRGVFLVEHGPYEIIRHPIYAGVALILSSLVQFDPALGRMVAFVLFLVVCVVKLNMEERVMESVFKKEYVDYEAKTHKVIPYFY
jgi:protein-S-isoprenylcysteine O-methyltransferase Ste14